MAKHLGRVAATDERRYVVGRCDGSLDIGADRLTIQGEDHANGRARAAVVIERADVATLRLRVGLLGGATLERDLPSGYRSFVIRPKTWTALLDDLDAHAWPVACSGLRAPRR